MFEGSKILVNGKDDIPYRKWKIKLMFETTNQCILPLDWILPLFSSMDLFLSCFIAVVPVQPRFRDPPGPALWGLCGFGTAWHNELVDFSWDQCYSDR
jgi:hypothetical protein